MSNLMEIGKRIATEGNYTAETAAALNNELSNIFGGKKDTLGLNTMVYVKNTQNLNIHISGIIIRIAEMQEKAEKAGRVTPAATEAVAKLITVLER